MLAKQEYFRATGRKRRTWQKPDTEFDLLIDIQKKIAEGKGRSFETWATNHNTKQIVKAIYYLEQAWRQGLQ